MTWTAAQIRAVRRHREDGRTIAEISALLARTRSQVEAICHQYEIYAPDYRPHHGPDPAPSEAWLLPLLDRYPHDYTDPKARVRRAELDRRQRA